MSAGRSRRRPRAARSRWRDSSHARQGDAGGRSPAARRRRRRTKARGSRRGRIARRRLRRVAAERWCRCPAARSSWAPRRRADIPPTARGRCARCGSSRFRIDADRGHERPIRALRRRRPGHVTEAERFGWSFVFGGLLPDDFPPTRGVAAAPWWRQVEGADWRQPEGPQSEHRRTRRPPRRARVVERRAGVLRVGGHTAADRGRVGVRGARRARAARFPWGDELEPGGEHRMNVWQGTFPATNTCDDGYSGTAPVDAFAPNGFGLLQHDRQRLGVVRRLVRPDLLRAQPARATRAGPPAGRTVMRGGSYLCHAPTATATAWPRAARTRPTARPATSASAAPRTPDTSRLRRQ